VRLPGALYFLHGSSNSFGHVKERVIPTAPIDYRLSVFGERRQVTKRCIVPVSWSKDYWNQASPTVIVSANSHLHFAAVAVVRCEEVRAYKEQNDVTCTELTYDFSVERKAGFQLAVMPRFDSLRPLQGREVLF
jgi:hypothetical protein